MININCAGPWGATQSARSEPSSAASAAAGVPPQQQLHSTQAAVKQRLPRASSTRSAGRKTNKDLPQQHVQQPADDNAAQQTLHSEQQPASPPGAASIILQPDSDAVASSSGDTLTGVVDSPTAADESSDHAGNSRVFVYHALLSTTVRRLKVQKLPGTKSLQTSARGCALASSECRRYC